MSNLLYEQDFYAWTQEQATLVKNKKFSSLDLLHLEEELYLMGASERRELSHRLEILLMYLLKWKYQPSRQCKSWERTIKVQRLNLIQHLKQNPSLRARIDEFIEDAYVKSILLAAEETNLDESVFPNNCEWCKEQILDNNFYPS